MSQLTNAQTGVAITVNGIRREAAGGATVLALLEGLGIEQGRVAVERNGVIVRRPAWGETAVEAGDQFEIVHFVGGG